MKTACVFASLLASAAAFAPAQQKASSSTALNGISPFAEKIGAQAPLGYFDPLGMLKDKGDDTFDRLRFLELKHRRVAMLAFMGIFVQDLYFGEYGDLIHNGSANLAKF